jgi:Na+/H+ antiporter NhaD/arsenite permease-like protein
LRIYQQTPEVNPIGHFGLLYEDTPRHEHRVENLYLLPLISACAGNLIIAGSIANLITVEQAKRS